MTAASVTAAPVTVPPMAAGPEGEIRRFIVENFLFGDAARPFADTDSLIENDMVDSTGILELVAFVEETFAISIADAEILPANLDSVARIVAFVARKRAEPTVLAGAA